MKIEKNVLNEALKVLGKVVSQNSPLEARRSVWFLGVGEQIWLAAVNETESVVLELSGDADGLGDFAVEFKTLRELVRSTRGSMVEVVGTKIEWPECPVVPADAVSVALPSNFTALLAEAAPVVNREESRPAWQGINLSRDGITVTDGKQLLNLLCPLYLRDDVTLPFPLALLTAKPEESGILQVWHEKEFRYFRMEIGRFLWMGRAQPGNFPEWKQIVPRPQLLDYSIAIHEPERVITFLKTVPDHPPYHGVELNVTSTGVDVIPVDYSHMILNVAAEHVGTQPRAVLALNKHILLRMLLQGYQTFRANADGRIPVVAEGGHGRYMVMPVHIKPKDSVKRNMKK